MIRPLLIAWLACLSLPAFSDDCYYYWVAQCIDVTDASQREFQQTVLISPAVNYLNSAEGQQCSEAVAQKQAPVNAELLQTFNQAASRGKACTQPITELQAKVYNQPGKASWHYQHSKKERPHKTVIMVSGTPVLK
ncbi:hypothetical protein A11A3_01350 [Alcanivorax hongdengensis A-11-3]|uniref:Lipoprotein n=1 Tax=Alcanivorax hongdengensis A-11-3 TaxID=1177179 RepID=L0WGV3_9GAMM|nr:hypothetical protein [Alcanivorax hongdengensis]EKF76098.1 hypothetical protein A11A3_01350 [Alcanivorax hongdengensis A-11-3]